MPRTPEDIISTGPIIEKFPEEVSLTSNSITLERHSIYPGTSRTRYGKTTKYELGVIEPDANLRTIHNVILPGLTNSTIYNLQAFSVANSDTSFSAKGVKPEMSPNKAAPLVSAGRTWQSAMANLRSSGI